MSAASLPVSDPAARELADLIEQLSARLQQGRDVDWDAVERDHPRHAAELRRLLPTLAVLADLSRSADASGAPAGGAGHRELGDFRIVREVGRGGMGVVYEAEQLSLGRRVALKVLPLAGAMDPRHLQRFQIEARAAAGLHHPHIVPVYAVGTDRGVHFYAMQFVDGQTLAEVIARRREPAASPDAPTAEAAGATTPGPVPTDPRAVAGLIADAADALDYAHSLGIVHRDIKPGNLMLDAAGRVWVTDFGLAKLGTDVGLTMTGDVLGTLRYMSPEQALARHGLVDHRADVYALGATLYELLTGAPAVPGDDRAEVLRRLAEADPVPPRKLAPAVPHDLETVCLKCLEKEPARRYQSARDLADDLRRFLDHKPVLARRPTVADRARKWARRHRPLVAAGVVALGLTTIGMAVATALVWREKDRTQNALTAKGEALADKELALSRAEARTEFARDAADAFYGEFVEGWLDLKPNKTPETQAFLNRALAFFEMLAAERGDDPKARGGAAIAAVRVGSIQYYLGRAVEAEPVLERAAADLRELSAAAPDNHALRENLADCLNVLGAMYRDTGRGPAAVEAFAESVRVLDAGKGNEARRSAEWTLTRAAANLGAVQGELGQPVEAERTLRRAVMVGERLVAANPGYAEARTLLASVYNNLGAVLSQQGRGEDAEREHRAGLKVLDRPDGAFAPIPVWVYHQAHLNANLGRCLAGRGQFPAAADASRRAEADVGRLVAAFPQHAAYRDLRAGVRSDLGRIALALDRASDAELKFNQSLADWRELIAGDGTLTRPREYLAEAAGHLAGLLVRDNRAATAEPVLREAVAAVDRVPPDRRSPVGRENLGRCLFMLGVVARRDGRVADAEAAYRRAVEVSTGLVADFPDAKPFIEGLATSLNNLGTLLEATGRVDAAVEQYEAALRARPEHRSANVNLERIRAAAWQLLAGALAAPPRLKK